MKYKLDGYFQLIRNKYLLSSFSKGIHNKQNEEENKRAADERIGQQGAVEEGQCPCSRRRKEEDEDDAEPEILSGTGA